MDRGSMDVKTSFSGLSKCFEELNSLMQILRGMEWSARTLALRSSIIIALMAAVATILYFTPLPDQYPQPCSRSCHELDWPMICRVKLTLERYRTLGGACGDCPRNLTECRERRCVTGDGRERGILTVNRQLPGPVVQVCQNDIIVVDVVNRIPGQSFGIHWRGQDQRETPHMDGVPMVTQCPIPSYTTFQYKFRASREGTHMWQVNTGEEMMETLFGAFIVKQPETRDVHKGLYDVDDASHVISLHTLGPDRRFRDGSSNSDPPTTLLINGKTKESGFPAADFRVARGKRYRFRVVVGGDSNGCRIRFSVDEHRLLVFALDGNSVRPRNVTSILLSPGERVDFALKADRPAGEYAVRASPEESCSGLREATADLVYSSDNSSLPSEGNSDRDSSATPTEVASRDDDGRLRPPERSPSKGSQFPAFEMSTATDEECLRKDRERLCPEQMESPNPFPVHLKKDPDQKFYLFYNLGWVHSRRAVFTGAEDAVLVPQANNVTMTFPSSPLLSQSRDVAEENFCDGPAIPRTCRSAPEEACECVHVLTIRLGATVELILVNQDGRGKPHRVFHLHGYAFHLVGSNWLTRKQMTPEEIRRLDDDGELAKRNLENSLARDTVALPYGGVAVLRFKADNPGYWILGEEHSSCWSRGMSVILRVGKDSDVPSPPPKFPKCGNWIGPEFFLV